MKQLQSFSSFHQNILQMLPLDTLFSSNKSDELWLERLRTMVLHHISNNQLNVEILAQELKMSRRSLERKLKALINQSPNQYITELRMQKAHELIEKHKVMTVREVTFRVGFSNSTYFSRLFKSQFGYTPKELIVNCKNENIIKK